MSQTLCSRLIYASRWSEPHRDDTPEMLENILASSVRNNTAAGLTGILLYREGWFLQLLEGDLDAVDVAFDRIRRDRRHLDVRIVSDDGMGERLFGDWSMCANHVADIPEADLARLGLSGPFDPARLDADKAVGLLEAAARARKVHDQAA